MMPKTLRIACAVPVREVKQGDGSVLVYREVMPAGTVLEDDVAAKITNQNVFETAKLDLGGMSAADLRETAAAAGIDTEGMKKADLIEALT